MTIAMAPTVRPADAAQFQFAVSGRLIPAFGVHFALGVDGIALVLIALSACLVPVVLLAGWNDADGARGSVKGARRAGSCPQAAMVAFAATDVFLFYVFFGRRC